jgi:hypothetical protein
MVDVLKFFLALLAWLRNSQARREAEILYLRQQLIVLKRSAPARPNLKATDRLIFVCLYRLFPPLIDASIVFQPETLLRWHRCGFRLFWRWKSRRRVGRPALSADVRSLIQRISRENPLWGARQITEAFPWDQASSYLIRDRDSSYGVVVRKRIRVGIRDRPTAPRSPWQNGHIERLIGSIRRECLDHVLVLSEAHLRLILRAYADYYNRTHTHLALGKDPPLGHPVQVAGLLTAIPLLGGLHHEYVRMA